MTVCGYAPTFITWFDVKIDELKPIIPYKLWWDIVRQMKELVMVVELQRLHRQWCGEFVRWQPLWIESMHKTETGLLKHIEIRSKNLAKCFPNHCDELWNKNVSILFRLNINIILWFDKWNTNEIIIFLPSNAFYFFDIETNTSCTTIFCIGKCLIKTKIMNVVQIF